MVPEVWSGNMCSPDNPGTAAIRWLEMSWVKVELVMQVDVKAKPFF